MSPIKRIFRGTKSFTADVTTQPVKVSFSLPYTVVPSKCDVTLYGNGSNTSSFTTNLGFYVDSLTSSTLTVGFGASNVSLHGKSVISYQIVEYN